MSMQAQTTSTYALPPVLDFATAEGFQASLIEKLQAALIRLAGEQRLLPAA